MINWTFLGDWSFLRNWTFWYAAYLVLAIVLLVGAPLYLRRRADRALTAIHRLLSTAPVVNFDKLVESEAGYQQWAKNWQWIAIGLAAVGSIALPGWAILQIQGVKFWGVDAETTFLLVTGPVVLAAAVLYGMAYAYEGAVASSTDRREKGPAEVRNLLDGAIRRLQEGKAAGVVAPGPGEEGAGVVGPGHQEQAGVATDRQDQQGPPEGKAGPRSVKRRASFEEARMVIATTIVALAVVLLGRRFAKWLRKFGRADHQGQFRADEMMWCSRKARSAALGAARLLRLLQTAVPAVRVHK